MNAEDFQDFIDAYNADEFDTFEKLYADDVRLDFGGGRQFFGRQAVMEFHKDVKKRVEETLTVKNVIVDEAGLAAEIEATFRALEDWPDFIAGPMRAGDTLQIVNFVIYRIEDEKFADIKSARFQTL